MPTTKPKKSTKGIKNLPAKQISAKQAKSIKGGDKPIESIHFGKVKTGQ